MQEFINIVRSHNKKEEAEKEEIIKKDKTLLEKLNLSFRLASIDYEKFGTTKFYYDSEDSKKIQFEMESLLTEIEEYGHKRFLKISKEIKDTKRMWK